MHLPTLLAEYQRSSLACFRRLVVSRFLVYLAISSFAYAEDWPQWRGVNRDGVWSETGIIEKFDSPQIELKWRVPIAGGYSGPTVANGRVYITGRNGTTLVLQRGKELKVLATNVLDDRVDASAALAGNQLFLRGSKYLYCIAEEK